MKQGPPPVPRTGAGWPIVPGGEPGRLDIGPSTPAPRITALAAREDGYRNPIKEVAVMGAVAAAKPFFFRRKRWL